MLVQNLSKESEQAFQTEKKAPVRPIMHNCHFIISIFAECRVSEINHTHIRRSLFRTNAYLEIFKNYICLPAVFCFTFSLGLILGRSVLGSRNMVSSEIGEKPEK